MSRPIAYYDTEVFQNFVLCAAMTEDGKKYAWFGVHEDLPVQELNTLRRFIKEHTLITFNGTGYDIPILTLVVKGKPVREIKRASNRIVVDNLQPWGFEEEFDVKLKREEIDTIDLMEVAPLTGGLKLYAGKCHSESIQELPVAPDKILTQEEKEAITIYCYNDLLSTRDLHHRLKVQIHLREQMGKQYGIDLRSKSDAQMAEAIIKVEIEKIKKMKVYKPNDLTGMKFQYQIPSWMKFRDMDVLERVRAAEFTVSSKGKVVDAQEESALETEETEPKKVKSQLAVFATPVEYRGKTYKMGVGGLHSNEYQQVLHADDNTLLMDFDVASYYPAIVLNLGLFPAHLGKEFLLVYKTIVDRRLAAKKRVAELKGLMKKTQDKVELYKLETELKETATIMEGLKIAINGTFGKLGNKYSIMYSPNLLVQVTLTGQLALLMLIEAFGQYPGIEVVSANTDGVTVRCPKDHEDTVMREVAVWELETEFVVERTDYRALFMRDVNNYVAIKTNGEYKAKGQYGKGLPLHKNPTNEISGEAVVGYLQFEIPIEETVRQCDDIRKFITLRTVKGGATFRDKDAGKIVRWYYSNDVEGRAPLYYKVNGHLVPMTDPGVKPIMVLPKEVPSDLNREWYVEEAKSMVREMGLTI